MKYPVQFLKKYYYLFIEFNFLQEYEHINTQSLEGRKLISKNFLQVNQQMFFDCCRQSKAAWNRDVKWKLFKYILYFQVHILFERSRLIKFVDKPALDISTVIGSLGGKTAAVESAICTLWYLVLCYIFTQSVAISLFLAGILNLWIGISFVTIFEVVELIYCLLKYRDSA